MILTILTALSCAIWIYLIFFNCWFWLSNVRLGEAEDLQEWPEVVAVIPARNEAESISSVVAAHMKTNYPGRFSVIVVDDQSDDGTGDLARKAGQGATRTLHVIDGKPLPEGWSGKLWAVNTGLNAAETLEPNASYVLLTDADIVHAPDVLQRLVYEAYQNDRALVSIMAKLDARGFWGGLLIPAFIFFFQKLYPFPSTNDSKRKVAGAAGGCMLVERMRLREIGGVESVRNTLIDDCSLAERLKLGGRERRAIFLGFDEGVQSLRDNRALQTIWKMVSRTAFTQLGFSTLALIGTVFGMFLIYLVGPLAFFTLPLHGSGLAFTLGSWAWFAAIVAYAPTLRLYRKPLYWALLLPLSGVLYTAMTISSAVAYWRGKGGLWKGRTYA
ncbi:MAG: glycosyltransferase [Pseudomonadota bacterium]